MYRFLILFVCLPVFITAQNSVQTYKNPVITGDVPDPTVIRVDDDYYAAATTSDLAPNYPLFHSRDLINWERIGAVFNDPPEWIKGDCWAPELFYHNGTYFVYYTARKKSDNISCIGVATTKDIRKGFTDHGPLIEWGNEAIDAYIFKEDDGKLFITWKAYGLDERPIEIRASELSDDGLTLIGEHFTLTDHTKGWVGYGDEGQCIVKRNGYYYHFYSIGGCCDYRCDYRVVVARATSLRGDWEQYSGNPILQGGDTWRCSGHGTLVQTPDDRYFYLYHAYNAYDFDFVGRQGLLDELLWDETTGWPYFRYGDTPTAQAEVPFPGTIQRREKEFYDNFTDTDKDQYYLWDMNLPRPVLMKLNGVLSFTTNQTGISFRGMNLPNGNFITETQVPTNSKVFQALCMYGNKENYFSLGNEGKKIVLYKVDRGTKTELYSANTTADKVYLKIEAVNGRLYRFHWSDNGDEWISFPEGRGALDGIFMPQWGKGIRTGILIDNPGSEKGYFNYFRMESKYW